MNLHDIPWLLILFPAWLFAQTQFGFEGERLDFALVRSSISDSLLWSVSGDYYLSNLQDQALSRLIAFPVPSSPDIGVAENIELELVEPEDSMTVELIRHSEQSFHFRLDLPPRTFARLHISYTQKIFGKTAHYVLLTANSWGRPLPYCEITLSLAPGIELLEMPFPSPEQSSDGGANIFTWKFVDFSPDRDFILSFR